ncbi:hypothetical protein OG21DRAFT_516815 [Imleria badia]|nr:hypothetical protein OG21DRAFT_516815 [Imleria badia]
MRPVESTESTITRDMPRPRISWSPFDAPEPRFHGGEMERVTRGSTKGSFNAGRSSSTAPKPKKAWRNVNKQQVNIRRTILSQMFRGSSIWHAWVLVPRLPAIVNDRFRLRVLMSSRAAVGDVRIAPQQFLMNRIPLSCSRHPPIGTLWVPSNPGVGEIRRQDPR